EVGLYYDPMLAKLIVWGADRQQAVTRMRRSLVELTILGVETSRDFHIRVMDDAEFQRGDIDIQWLERRLPSLLERRPGADHTRVAAIAAVLLAEHDRTARSVSTTAPAAGKTGRAVDAGADGWKQAARADGLRN
ncbi:MAG: acetyl-CoA carboxylase biotin carboxylase subunit, partial [Gemmatimonadota bacterium]|nr:acetyl-CoA carboxylase biotin carboxylase subunit [Gemmatimonadota bacterium]